MRKKLSVFMSGKYQEILRERMEAMIRSLIDAGLLQDASAVRLPWGSKAGGNVEEMAIEAVQADVLLVLVDADFLSSKQLEVYPFNPLGRNLLPMVRRDASVMAVYLSSCLGFEDQVQEMFGGRMDLSNILLLPEKQGDERPALMTLAAPTAEEIEEEWRQRRTRGEVKLRENLGGVWTENVEAHLIEVLSKLAA